MSHGDLKTKLTKKKRVSTMTLKQNLKRILLALTMGFVFASSLLAATASITTDKTKYSVGDTMTISGTGFTPSQSVNISVLRPDHLTDYVLYVVADGSGAFTAKYTPSDPVSPGRYKITATDALNTATTASTEADAAAANLD